MRGPWRLCIRFSLLDWRLFWCRVGGDGDPAGGFSAPLFSFSGGNALRAAGVFALYDDPFLLLRGSRGRVRIL